MTTSVSAAHPGNGFLKGGPAMPFSQDMGGGVAMNDLVPIEKRLNPAMSVGANVPGANNPMPGAGNPNIMMSSNSPGVSVLVILLFTQTHAWHTQLY